MHDIGLYTAVICVEHASELEVTKSTYYLIPTAELWDVVSVVNTLQNISFHNETSLHFGPWLSILALAVLEVLHHNV